jgi:hypothetical protein
MKHYTEVRREPVKDTTSPQHNQEFDVLITGSQVIFSWNSMAISEIAHTLGEPEIDLEPCG